MDGLHNPTRRRIREGVGTGCRQLRDPGRRLWRQRGGAERIGGRGCRIGTRGIGRRRVAGAGEPSRSNGSSVWGPARTKSRSRPRRRSSRPSTTARSRIELTLTIVDNTEASTTLATRIAAGDSPDIIGPVGIRGLQSFGDQLLDLDAVYRRPGTRPGSIRRSWTPTTSTARRSASRWRSTRRSSTTTRPSSTRPTSPSRRTRSVSSTTAGLELGDAPGACQAADRRCNGNDATSADFDPAKSCSRASTRSSPRTTRAHGRRSSAAQARSWATTARRLSGPTTGRRAPVLLRRDLEGPLHPGWTAVQSLADGNTFKSGRIAMDVVHQWYTCCVLPDEGGSRGPSPIGTSRSCRRARMGRSPQSCMPTRSPSWPAPRTPTRRSRC